MNRIYYIYKITNLINNKIYIGQSVDVKQRWRQHKWESKKEKPLMAINKAMKKYGVDNFKLEIIASCLDWNAANDAETLLVTQEQSHISLGKGYNISNGGFNAPKTEEWKKKTVATRRANNRYIASEETRKKMSTDWHIKHPLEGRKRTADSNRGRPCSEERRQKIAKANKGKQFCLGHKQPAEVIQKRVNTIAALYGDKNCNYHGCDRVDGSRVNGVRYCKMHGKRLRKTGILELRPRPAPNKGKKMSEASKLKLSNSLKGKPAPNKGIPHSAETKEKLRLLNLGKEPPNKMKFTDEQTAQILSDNRSIKNIAKDFNVSTTVIVRLRKLRKTISA